MGRAVRKSANATQKRVLFIAAAGADDFFSKLFDVQTKPAKLFTKSTIEKRLRKQQVNTAFRIYLSTLLILLGNHRDRLLKETGLSEADWIQLWCWVFEYHSEDMTQFNNALLPAYQSNRLDGLTESATSLILEALSSVSSELPVSETVLKDALVQDMAAILKALSPEKGA